MENFENKKQEADLEAGSKQENAELTRNKLVQFEQDSLTVAEAGAADHEQAAKMSQAFEAVTHGASSEQLMEKYREIKGRKGESFDQKM